MSNKADDLFLKSVGKKLRRAREFQKLTQTEVATAAGITRQSLGHIEAGEANPSIIKLSKIAAALGFKLGLNFFLEKHMQNPKVWDPNKIV